MTKLRRTTLKDLAKRVYKKTHAANLPYTEKELLILAELMQEEMEQAVIQGEPLHFPGFFWASWTPTFRNAAKNGYTASPESAPLALSFRPSISTSIPFKKKLKKHYKQHNPTCPPSSTKHLLTTTNAK